MAKLQELQDPFNANTKNARWTQFTAGSATMSFTPTGAMTTFPATSSSATDGDISSTGGWDLTASYCFMEILTILGGTSNDCNLTLRDAGANTNVLQWEIEAGILYAQNIIASVSTNLAQTTYNNTTHRWLRIRESGGTTFWDTSADGAVWNSFFSKANPITMTNFTVNIGGLSFGVDTNAGSFQWRNFNTRIDSTKFNNTGLRPHPFSPGLAR